MTSNVTPHDARHDEPVLPAPRQGGDATPSGAAPHGTAHGAAPHGTPDRAAAAASPQGPDRPWSGRGHEARSRLVPERAVIPAPRSPGGVEVPPAFGQGPGAAPAALVRAVETLTARLAAVEDAPGEPAHRALLRTAALVGAGVPERGWSAGEDLDADALVAAAAIAGELHDEAASLLERLDAADRPSPAVVVDALVMSLRVVRMVVELEVFARTR